MTCEIKTERRWLRSVIAASTQPLPSLPWARGVRNPHRSVVPDRVMLAPQPTAHIYRPAIAAR